MIFQPVMRDDDITDVFIKIRQQAEILTVRGRLIDRLNACDACFQLQLAKKQFQHIC